MEMIKEVIAYISMHGLTIAGIITSILAVAEWVTRLTPTEKDDGFVERVGAKIRQLFDLLGKVFPNLKKGGGTHTPRKDQPEVQMEIKLEEPKKSAEEVADEVTKDVQ